MTDRPAVPSAIDKSARDAGCWAFGPRDAEFAVRNAELLLAHMPVFLSGWPFRRVTDGEGLEPAIEVRERPDGGFAVAMGGQGGGETVCPDAFAAADRVAGALVDDFVRQRRLLGLRAAAVQVGGRLVVLLGEALAGKSTVALHMAAAGHRLFAEDRLAMRLSSAGPAAAVCLGLTPRARLPLPAECSAAFREYVDSFTEMRNETAAFLKLWEGEAAGFLEEAPPAALVVLARGPGGPCELAPAAPAEIARMLGAAAGGQPVEGDVLEGFASGVSGYAVTFSSSREAAAAIAAALREQHSAPG